MGAGGYVDLQVTTNFSFLRGASHADELALTAAALGHGAIGVTDRNTLAGVVRMHKAAQQAGVKPVIGARLDLVDGVSVLCFPTDRAAYGRLSGLLTTGKRRAGKGKCTLSLSDLAGQAEGQLLVVLPEQPDGEIIQGGPADGEGAFSRDVASGMLERTLELAKDWGAADIFLGISHRFDGRDARRLDQWVRLAARCGTRLVATNDIRMHDPGRRPLLDVLTAIRLGVRVDALGPRAQSHGERYPKSPTEMAALFSAVPEAVSATVEIAERCRFSLDCLRYEYPDEMTEEGRTPQEELAARTWAGAHRRYPRGVPQRVQAALVHELALIGSLAYAPYFLTVEDIVRFARTRGILCQGRGSAANSAVCYCLGITAVDPGKADLLFERFVSAERREPPDIDVDFEHERREEVIQYIYRRFGRDHAGLAATVICYRARGAVRDVGKAMGLSEDLISALSGTIWGWGREGLAEAQVRELGLDPGEPRLAATLALAREIMGFPRHLSQHVGGFVVTRTPLSAVVPIENAAMADRTVIEWDKDDLDALGMLKIDVLALGMLTCVRKGFDLIARHYGRRFDLATVPAEDPVVYDMLCKGDSLGVFQVESRAQMSMLPRLKPRCFYDLVVEVAIVRPGPIQGDMVHPYLRRRSGAEQVSYPSEELRAVLEKTLGIPLFQEQAMRIAIVGAGFTPAEADRLRRAMATFRKVGIIHTFREKLIEGMAARGYERAFAERCFNQIEGFGTYGFPESHAASFALLVYVSSWMKCHYPAVFACALLNSQPMGFYAPAQIVRDARSHGVEVRGVDVNASDWDCTLEPDGRDGPALRLGFRQIKGLAEVDAMRVVGARGNGYPDMYGVWRRAGVGLAALEVLAEADAFGSLGLDRRAALWAVRGLGGAPLPLFAAMDEPDRGAEPTVTLPEMSIGEAVIEDYARLRLSLRAHPLALARWRLPISVVTSEALESLPTGCRVAVAGLVICRQRPGSANGVIFVTLEDERGVANVIVWPSVFEAQRRVLMTATLMVVAGKVQRESSVIHVVAETLIDRSDLLQDLAEADADSDAMGGTRPEGPPRRDVGWPNRRSQEFKGAQARADEVNRPVPDQRDPQQRTRTSRAVLSADPVKPDAGRAIGAGAARVMRGRLPGRNRNFPSRDFH